MPLLERGLSDRQLAQEFLPRPGRYPRGSAGAPDRSSPKPATMQELGKVRMPDLRVHAIDDLESFRQGKVVKWPDELQIREFDVAVLHNASKEHQGCWLFNRIMRRDRHERLAIGENAVSPSNVDGVSHRLKSLSPSARRPMRTEDIRC